MGYILPIQFDQYAQYQNRIEGKLKKPLRRTQVDRVKQAYLDPMNLAIKKEPVPYYFRKQPNDRKPTVQPGQKRKRIYAEITGIGRLFDEKI